MPLYEVRADTDMAFAGHTHQMLDGIDIVLNGRVVALGLEGRVHGDTDMPAVIGQPAQLLVCLVARVCKARGGADVAVGDGPFRGVDGVIGGAMSDVAEVDGDADAIHFRDQFAPEVGETTVVALEAAGADRVLPCCK